MGRLQIFESIEAISTISITLTSLSSIDQVLRQFQDAQLDSDDVLFRRHDPRSFDEEDCIYLSDLIYLLGSISTEPPPNPTPTRTQFFPSSGPTAPPPPNERLLSSPAWRTRPINLECHANTLCPSAHAHHL